MSKELLSKALRSSKGPGISKSSNVPASVKSKHGQEIYVYSHLQTNQVVYSLGKQMNNNNTLSQLPYNGKKTVPRALRKDLWTPFAKIEFGATTGSASAGLNAFRKLREYRRLHELSWPDSVALDKDGKPLSRTARGRLLCDQKANSVADMAAALESVTGKIDGRFSILDETMSAEDRKKKRRVRHIMAKKVMNALKEVAQGEESEVPTIKATVKWANILDAEYAEKWPEHVVHDALPRESMKMEQLFEGTTHPSKAKRGEAAVGVQVENRKGTASTDLTV